MKAAVLGVLRIVLIAFAVLGVAWAVAQVF
jgi:hypothetical protein